MTSRLPRVAPPGQVLDRRTAKGTPAVPDLLIGSDGAVYVTASAIDAADRKGRRFIRAYALTPREAKGVARSLSEVAPELLVGVVPRPRRKANRRSPPRRP